MYLLLFSCVLDQLSHPLLLSLLSLFSSSETKQQTCLQLNALERMLTEIDTWIHEPIYSRDFWYFFRTNSKFINYVTRNKTKKKKASR